VADEVLPLRAVARKLREQGDIPARIGRVGGLVRVEEPPLEVVVALFREVQP